MSYQILKGTAPIDAFKTEYRRQLEAMWKPRTRQLSIERELINSLGLYENRIKGDFYWLKNDDGRIVSLNVSYVQKSKAKNAWGRYLNVYLALTLPDHRQYGYAKELMSEVERQALLAGCKRLKSLAGSPLGALLHLSLGHSFWGPTPKGELKVDSQLGNADLVYLEFPNGVPIEARQNAVGKAPLTATQILEIMEFTSTGPGAKFEDLWGYEALKNKLYKAHKELTK